MIGLLIFIYLEIKGSMVKRRNKRYLGCLGQGKYKRSRSIPNEDAIKSIAKKLDSMSEDELKVHIKKLMSNTRPMFKPKKSQWGKYPIDKVLHIDNRQDFSDMLVKAAGRLGSTRPSYLNALDNIEEYYNRNSRDEE